ncbi:GGDEF domain-containing protein [Sphingomonas yunnanensis]|uniref:GGDEF domain-containing protein n=1 Tax=Sphingomonas yunnanensis TaxID=310400 RepID=UPI001CA6C5C1|nr:GGDEF domain-containing protein [Sphingomonas yunnanensis]MBY9063617.1 GGDEF domain-containing protein [Sphingomonas yunnanensis]
MLANSRLLEDHGSFWRRSAGAVLLLLTCVLGLGEARAGCMRAPTPGLQTLADEAGRDPPALLLSTKGDPLRTDGDLAWGWRMAARAEAYDTLSQPANARSTVLQVTEAGATVDLPLRVELLARAAMNGLTVEEVERIASSLASVLDRTAPDIVSIACLQIARGEARRLSGAPERAVSLLASAYRLTKRPGRELPHVIATEKLARVLNAAGDHLQAIALIEEVIAWDTTHDRKVALANDLYFRGLFNLSRGAYAAALADFDLSRMRSPRVSDPVGSAYLDLQTCAALIELHRLLAAKPLCRQAQLVFDAWQEPASAQAQLLRAKMEWISGRHARALELLDQLLEDADRLSSFASAPQAYRLRADVNRAMGRTESAYRDLERSVRLDERRSAYERTRQTAVLRASFEADRSAARTEELARSLRFARERESEQAQRYRQLAWSAALGLLMLGTMLIMGVSHRRKLSRVADTDPLTGLLNRRCLIGRERNLFHREGFSAASTVALLDIDHFKAINDAYGHNVGDEVLKHFAALLASSAGKEDVVARWGGEEFVLVFRHRPAAHALGVLEEIRSRLLEQVEAKVAGVQVRFSAGVTSSTDGEPLHTVIARADRALYRAKELGRDRIEVEGVTEHTSSDSPPATIGLAPAGASIAESHGPAATSSLVLTPGEARLVQLSYED